MSICSMHAKPAPPHQRSASPAPLMVSACEKTATLPMCVLDRGRVQRKEMEGETEGGTCSSDCCSQAYMENAHKLWCSEKLPIFVVDPVVPTLFRQVQGLAHTASHVRSFVGQVTTPRAGPESATMTDPKKLLVAMCVRLNSHTTKAQSEATA